MKYYKNGFKKSEQKEAYETFLANPHYREEYENAPSEVCREYIAYQFCGSTFEYPDDSSYQDCLFDKMSAEDFLYMSKYVGNNPLKGYFLKRAQEHGRE